MNSCDARVCREMAALQSNFVNVLWVGVGDGSAVCVCVLF